MAPSRTPPGEDPAAASKVAQFDALYLSWRKLLYRTNSTRIKILQALSQDGSAQAADLLGERPRYENATRCQNCAGCAVMAAEKACRKCRGCADRDGCVEYTRLCFSWDRVAVNHVSGSVYSGVSSNFDLATGDLGKYTELVEELKNVAVQIELGLDDLPPSHLHRRNPRYGPARLQKDIDNEEAHLAKLERMMSEYRDQSDRLRDFDQEQFDLERDRDAEHEVPRPRSSTARELSAVYTCQRS